MTSEAMATEPAEKPKDLVTKITEQVPLLSMGDRAALRRIYLTQSYAADGVVARLLYRSGVAVPPPDKFAPWRLFAHVAALLSGTGAKKPHMSGGGRVGRALHEVGFSENRLLRLTSTRGEALHDQIIRAARMLAQKGEAPLDLWPLFNLVGSDPASAEAARIRIAQDYYIAEARSEGNKK